MIIRALRRPPALRISGARYISAQRDPLRKKPSTSRRTPKPSPSPPDASPQPSDAAADPPRPPSVSETLAGADPAQNNLLAPVHIPDDEGAIIRSQHPATKLLANSGLVVQRQIEMMNLFLGFEQANRYVIMDPQGNHVGYMAEHDGGFGKAMGRQWFRTHRAFTTHVFDREQKEVLRFHRPFSWINSRIRVYDPLEPSSNYSTYTSPSTSLSTTAPPADTEAARQISPLPLDAMRIIGEAHSEWAPLRRKYNLFLSHDPSSATGTPPISSAQPPSDISALQQTQLQRQNQSAEEPHFTQFASINEPFLSWDFSLLSASNQLIGSVNRNFAGFAREIFTDTGVYALRMDSAGLEEEAAKTKSGAARVAEMGIGQKAYQETVGGSGDKTGMTLDQRAVMLATAVTVDFDYFSRHSGAGGVGFMPFMWGGGGEAAGGAAGGAAGAGAGAGAAGAGEVAGAAGATGIGEAAGGAVLGGAGRAAGGVAAGAGEGAMAGAGTIAGYEAMQRSMGRSAEGQEADSGEVSGQEQGGGGGGNVPGYGDEYGQGGFPEGQGPQQFGNEGEGQGQDLWGSGDGADPWTGGGDGGGGMEGGAEGAGGGGFIAWILSFFFGD